MISDDKLLGSVRYAISIAAYNLYKARYRGDHRIEPWLRKLCEELAVDGGTQWPDISSKDNPWLCEFCGTQLGTHYAHAMLGKGANYDDCCPQLLVNPDQNTLFYGTTRIKLESALATYMQVPRHIIKHCMALELITYLQCKKDVHNERVKVSSSDANGFERVTSLF